MAFRAPVGAVALLLSNCIQYASPQYKSPFLWLKYRYLTGDLVDELQEASCSGASTSRDDAARELLVLPVLPDAELHYLRVLLARLEPLEALGQRSDRRLSGAVQSTPPSSAGCIRIIAHIRQQYSLAQHVRSVIELGHRFGKALAVSIRNEFLRKVSSERRLEPPQSVRKIERGSPRIVRDGSRANIRR